MSLFIMFLVSSSSIFDIVMIDNEFMYKFAKRSIVEVSSCLEIRKRTDTVEAFTRLKVLSYPQGNGRTNYALT